MLNKEIVESFKKAKKEYDKLHESIHNEISRVCKAIGKACNKKPPSNFWIYGAAEGEFGTINEQILDCTDDCISLEMNHGDWNKFGEISIRYLYMTDEDIIAEIKNEIKQEEIKKDKAKIKRNQRKLDKEQALKEIKNKLTSQELKALGVKQK